jgi:hypothetical protein
MHSPNDGKGKRSSVYAVVHDELTGGKGGDEDNCLSNEEGRGDVND